MDEADWIYKWHKLGYVTAVDTNEETFVVTLNKGAFKKKIKVPVRNVAFRKERGATNGGYAYISDFVTIDPEINRLMKSGWVPTKVDIYPIGKKASEPQERKPSKKEQRFAEKYKAEVKKDLNQQLNGKLVNKRFDVNNSPSPDVSEIVSILAELAGSGEARSKQLGRYNIDIIGLSRAYEMGENPLDYLSRPVEHTRQPLVLLSPDVSGSCANDMGLFTEIADRLRKTLNCAVVENVNGVVVEGAMEILSQHKFDLVLYSGDFDIFSSGDDDRSLLKLKIARTVVLSNYCARVGVPRLHSTTKDLITIDRVDLRCVSSLKEALRLAVKSLK